MRPIFLFMLALPMAIFTAPFDAEALSDAESKKMFTQWVHSYYKSDADTFWRVSSQFKEPMFESQEKCRYWLEDRLVLKETYLKVQGIIVYGMARIASEEIGEIDFRFDGSVNSPTRVIVVTAKIDRVIEFDETVAPEHRKINQVAYLKLYVTLVNERLLGFHSDEINLGYSFADSN